MLIELITEWDATEVITNEYFRESIVRIIECASCTASQLEKIGAWIFPHLSIFLKDEWNNDILIRFFVAGMMGFFETFLTSFKSYCRCEIRLFGRVNKIERCRHLT